LFLEQLIIRFIDFSKGASRTGRGVAIQILQINYDRL